MNNEPLQYNVESMRRTSMFFSLENPGSTNCEQNSQISQPVANNYEPITEEIDNLKYSVRVMNNYSHVKKAQNSIVAPVKSRSGNASLLITQNGEQAGTTAVMPFSYAPSTDNSNTQGSAGQDSMIKFAQYKPTSALEDVGLSLSTADSLYEEKPTWRPPWELMVVISGHLGAVKSISVDPSNQWFATGSADRTIRIWDLARHELKITLTGHIANVEAVIASERHPYLFSCGDDHKVMCWDLETNKIIRHYFGHRGGVYTLDLHNSLDLLVTGGRDRSVMVWDIRTKKAVYIFQSHTKTVFKVAAQSDYPQVVSGSADMTIRFWDLVAGKCMSILTNHSKAVRTLLLHPTLNLMASAGADAIKKWKLPEGNFIQNFDGAGSQGAIHTISLNNDNLFVAGTNDGNLEFYDWKSVYRFQTLKTIPQPGSLQSEALIYASQFDRSGSRLITGEGDKTIKIWREVLDATPETHPFNWKPQRRKLQW